jgi:hypothetical protein
MMLLRSARVPTSECFRLMFGRRYDTVAVVSDRLVRSDAVA